MKKLVIQIPCWNEEADIARTLYSLPMQVEGFDVTETLVIDDGSTDQTVFEANKAGAHHIITLNRHEGLAAAFETGVHYALSIGASVVINTDADNQYCASGIQDLVKPILQEKIDMVIGDRNTSKLGFLPFWKKLLYRIAAHVVTWIIRTKAPDPTSGFRAMTRNFISEISLKDRHSYTIETLLQAVFTGRKVKFVSVRTNPVTRPSRLIKSTLIYMFKTSWAMVYAIFTYAVKPKCLRLFFLKQVVLEGQD
ncbi:MAG: glycosyltransferase family 2 protein [Proteobacteria bacterium]|nr:glycosyltransferase family 2 protein [Pseudomonadota bacterium]